MAPRKTKSKAETELEEIPEFEQVSEAPKTSNPPQDELSDLFGGRPDLAGSDQRTSGRSGSGVGRKSPVREDGIVETPIDLDAQQSMAPTQRAATPDPVLTPVVPDEQAQSMQRSEEIAAELVRKNGRYIEGVDNVTVGRRIDGALNTTDAPMPISFAQQEYAYRSEGVNTIDVDGTVILDTGAGAQSEGPDLKEYEPNDPRSTDFMVCMNSNCNYRDGCLRYRMKNKRDNKALFFPEQCRADGTYIALDETSFTGYDSFESVDSPSAPNSLGTPE